MTSVALADVEGARERLAGIARVTPVYGSETLSRLSGREVQLKAENLQRTGSFKIRGAVNKLATLDEAAREAGVVAASAGNHGQAVAWAARQAGVAATIFVPLDAPMAKVEAARSYGARVEPAGETFDACVAAASEYVERAGAVFVHPFEDPVVIAGQGTIGLELAEQLPDVSTVAVPVGGGGLLAGIATVLRAGRRPVRIVGVLAGEDAFALADGIAVKQRGELAMSIVEEFADDLVTVSADEIAKAMVLLLERTKLLVEGAGAAGVAALLAGKLRGEGDVGIVLSGGNIDATSLIAVTRHGLTVAGRYLVVRTRFPDRPGELMKLLKLFADARANVLSVEHHREGVDLGIGETGVEVTLTTRDEKHGRELVDAMRSWGYEVELLE